MATRMLQRRGTAAEWAAANPTLGAGEIGFETDTKILKLGDGVTDWVNLKSGYARTNGGDVITASGVAVIPLRLRGIVGQTADVFNAETHDGNGLRVTSTGDVLHAGSPLLTQAENATADAAITSAYQAADAALQTDINTRIVRNVVDAKGDLIVATANDAVTRVPVGNNDQVLVADSTQASGVRWATPASGASFGFAEVFLHGGG